MDMQNDKQIIERKNQEIACLKKMISLLMTKETEFKGMLSPSTTFSLNITGPYGKREIGVLVERLQLAAKAKRIQRKRTKGWRLPENTVCVTRDTRWGNPFEAEYFGLALSIQLFRNSLNGIWNPSLMNGHDDTACNRAYEAHHAFLKRIDGHPLECVSELRGKNLACWCEKGKPCHANVLLEVANP